MTPTAKGILRAGAVVAAATAGVACGGSQRTAAPEFPPATASDAVRAYATAIGRSDAEAACRLTLRTGGTQQDCVVNLMARFNHPRVIETRWRSISMGRVRVRADGGLRRAHVELAYVSPSGRSRSLRDLWWLQRRAGRLVILRAGRFGSRALGSPGNLVETDRPLRPGQVARPAELRPELACGPTRRARPLRRGTVTEYRDGAFKPVDVPWLDLVRVEVTRSADGRACLRVYAAARWRVATSVGLSVDGRRQGRRVRAVDIDVRIDGTGRIRPVDVSKGVSVGADGRALTLVLPPRIAPEGDLWVSADSASLQAAEPLLRQVVNAGDPLEKLRISRPDRRAP